MENMRMVYDYSEYKKLRFTCEKCGWKGVGSETEEDDATHALVEIFCPKCFSGLGFYFWPENKKAKDEL